MGRQATHKVLLYESCAYSEEPLTTHAKCSLLRTGLRSCKEQGRVVLRARFVQEFQFDANQYYGIWGFETVYVGRKAVLNKELTHNLRRGYPDFKRQPLRMNLEAMNGQR